MQMTAAPAAVVPPPAPAPARSQKPATSTTATALPTTQPTQQTTTQPQPVNAPAPENVTSVVDQTHDGQNQQDVNTSAPPAEKNRNTAKAEAKLEKALEYLTGSPICGIAVRDIGAMVEQIRKIRQITQVSGRGDGNSQAKLLNFIRVASAKRYEQY
jgi:outer membrane biosynthesis protein TonB